jgi:hypothetical protein
MLSVFILKYRKMLLTSAVISLSMIFVKGVAVLTTESISLNKSALVNKLACTECGADSDGCSLKFLRETGTIVSRKKEECFSENLPKILASTTSIFL